MGFAKFCIFSFVLSLNLVHNSSFVLKNSFLSIRMISLSSKSSYCLKKSMMTWRDSFLPLSALSIVKINFLCPTTSFSLSNLSFCASTHKTTSYLPSLLTTFRKMSGTLIVPSFLSKLLENILTVSPVNLELSSIPAPGLQP